MKKARKIIASFAMTGMVLTTAPFSALAAEIPLRLAGATAADTAVEISKQTGWSGAAILTSSETYAMADALAAGPLAYYLKAPILLTENSSTLNAATKAELSRLNVNTVYVTSGKAVISQMLLNEITAMDITVVPLGGYDRAETSVKIAEKMSDVTKVAVANSVPDALSIASIAAAANQPILLVDKDEVSSSVTDYLAANSGITSSDVIGGTGVISDATANQFPNPTRHFGYTAYDTNNQVIRDFAAVLNFDIVYAANGATAIDALSGAPLAALTNSPIVLTDGKQVPAAAAFVAGKLGADGQVTALGGAAVITENTRQGIKEGNATPTEEGNGTLEEGENLPPEEEGVTSPEEDELTVNSITYNSADSNKAVSDQAFAGQKVGKIEVYSKVLGLVDKSSGLNVEQYGYASYRILDQHGADITKSELANKVEFQTGVGYIEAKNGLLEITPSSNLNLRTFGDDVTVTAKDPATGVATAVRLQISPSVGTLSEFQLKRLTNVNGKTEIAAADTAEVFYIEYEAWDIGGDTTTSYTLIKEGLILTGAKSDMLTTSSPHVAAKLVQDPADPDKGLIEVKAVGDTIQEDLALVITAMTWVGSNSQLSVTLKK